MKSAIMANGLRRSLAQIRFVSPVMPADAAGAVAAVYSQAERDFGMVAPPIALHSPVPSVLAAAWALLRETLLAAAKADRAEKEVVAAVVSAANACPYCVAVHTAAAQHLIPGLDPADIDVADSRLAGTAAWATSSGLRGSDQPEPPDNFAEFAGVAVTFHYLTRMVTLFLPESPLPPMTPKVMGPWVMGMLGSAMNSATPVPGAALDLVPEAPLPAEFAWAAGDPHIAAALGGAAQAIEDAAAPFVTAAVRELVAARLGAWDGSPPGPSRSWADEAVAGLAQADRPAGLLAIRTALAPYQVVGSDIKAYRAAAGDGDQAVIALTAWASMAAARTVAGCWRAQLSELAGLTPRTW